MYKRAEFEKQQKASAEAARIVVPLVLANWPATSVLDVGCGVGTWLKVFSEHGVAECLGVDGHHVDADLLKISRSNFLAHDLRTPIELNRNFDLACSLEVAEHLPAEIAQPFVFQLTKAAPAVLFSAALPGQSGPGHINEQWPSYWAGLFEKHRYFPLDVVRPVIWHRDEIVFWYRQNLLLYVREDRLPPNYVRPPLLDVAHPVMVQRLVHQINARHQITGREAFAALLYAVGRRLGLR